MSEDKIDSFAAMFAGSGFAANAERIEARATAERRQNLSDKQRSHSAKRSAQLNFRCSPAFKAQVVALTKHMGSSVADMMEEAVALLAREKGLSGGNECG